MTSETKKDDEQVLFSTLFAGGRGNAVAVIRLTAGPRFDSFGYNEQGPFVVRDGDMIKIGPFDAATYDMFQEAADLNDFQILEFNGAGDVQDQYFVTTIRPDASPNFGG